MDLSTLLLVFAVVAGLFGGVSARFRSAGTDLRDLTVGLLVGSLFAVFTTVVLVLVRGLDVFGVVHYMYLLLIVGLPVAIAIIVLPHLVDREFRTPLVVYPLILIALTLPALGYYGTHIEPDQLEVDRQGLGASGANRPVIVGVIADLQTPNIGDHERRAVSEVLAADPDLVVLPGDLFQLSEEEFAVRAPEFVGLVRRLTNAVDHVVIVEGNVDFADGLESIAMESGAVFLRDEIVELDLGGNQSVVVAGLSTPLEGDMSRIDERVTEQLAASYRSDDLVLLVTHRPDPVLTLESTSIVDLTIAGHTHGGQVSLPWIGPLITASEVPRQVGAGGLSLVNGHPIYVSTGVGLEREQAPQLRFGVPPSVAIITIVPT